MFCKECGKQLEDNTKFCPVCGTPTDNCSEKSKKKEDASSKNEKKETEPKIPWWKKIFKYSNYCIIMVVLVACAYITGNIGKKSTSGDRIELYDFINCTEDDLVKKMGFAKNEWGYYPSENSANIICIDGKVNTLRISENQEEVDMLSLCGITIGSQFSSVENEINNNFDRISSEEVVGGVRDLYVDKSNGYQLAVDYDKDGRIFSVAYVTEKLNTEDNLVADEPMQSENTEEVVENIQDREESDVSEEEQLTTEERMGQYEKGLKTLVFRFWTEYMDERILINLDNEEEGPIFIETTEYDEYDGTSSDELIEAKFIWNNTRSTYDIYSLDGDYTGVYFVLSNEECWMMDVTNENTGDVLTYLEEEYALENVG